MGIFGKSGASTTNFLLEKILREIRKFREKYQNGAVVYTFKKEVTSAQVLALNTTPIELVAAPGAGKIIVPYHIDVSLDYNSAEYTGDMRLIVKLDTTDAVILNTSGDYLGVTANTFVYLHPAGTSTLTHRVANKALHLTTNTSDPVDGDSPLTVYGSYIIVDE